jgi:hypothetical protein
MDGKYDKDNPMPKAELARLRRNTQRGIRTRSKARAATETLEQFHRILFQTVSSKNKELSAAELKMLDSAVRARVEEFVSSENDARLEAAQRLKDLFAGYGLAKTELLGAVKQTKWAKLNDEIFELEIQKGVDEIRAGYGIVLETKQDFENFFARIKMRGLRKLKRRQKAREKIKNNIVQP